MSRWFRFYADTLRNPKVMRLSDKDYRLWSRLLAVACENDGKLPPLDDLKLLLSMRYDHLNEGLNRLISGGLIDALATGYEPHNWSKFQYKSDTSNERVAKHRAKRNVTVTPPDTDTEQSIDTSVSIPPISPAKRGQSFALPEWVPEAEWLGFCEMRRRIRAPLTDRAKGQIVRQLEQLHARGHPPGRVLDQSTANAWRGVFELKDGTNDRNLGRNTATAGQFGGSAAPASGRLGAVLELLAETRAANGN
jgi:hypothetical protein